MVPVNSVQVISTPMSADSPIRSLNIRPQHESLWPEVEESRKVETPVEAKSKI